jgi:hypothetical protein
MSSVFFNSKNSFQCKLTLLSTSPKTNSFLKSSILEFIFSKSQKTLKYSFFQVLDNIENPSRVEKNGVLKIQFKQENLKVFDFSKNISLNSQENELR